MKKLIIILLLPFLSTAQDDNWYLSATYDVNKAFKITDNERTKIDKYGLDFDIEAGLNLTCNNIYIFYGRFENAGFWNYGLGYDYSPRIFRNLETSIGLGWSRIEDTKENSKHKGGVGGFYARAVSTIYLYKNLGITFRLQPQQRTDVSKGYIIEGAMGLKFIYNIR